jgi:hypothetical protein
VAKSILLTINIIEKNKTMSKEIRVLIILSIASSVFIGAGSLLTPSIAETIQPLADPQLNKEPLKEVMIFGASGTVGDGILKALIMDKNVQKIQVITRRLTPRIEEGVKLGKVVVTLHMNYLDYAPIKDTLSKVKAVYWAIGTSARNVNDAKYTEIHVDFPVTFVKFWLTLNKAKQKSFHLITGAGTGADSWFHWAREKAKAEIKLTAMTKGTGLKFLAYRPSFVAPSAERITFFKKLFYGPMEFLTFAVRSTQIGQSMIEVTMRGKEIGSGSILDHSSIRKFAEVYGKRNEKP